MPRFAQTALVRARWTTGSLILQSDLSRSWVPQLLIDKEAPQAGLIRINRHITATGEGRAAALIPSGTAAWAA